MPALPPSPSRAGGTLSGGIINAGRIAGISSGTRSYGVAVDELVQGGISNSGSIAINTTNAGFVEAYGIDVGENLGGSVTTFAGGLSNGGTISVTMNGTGIDGDGVASMSKRSSATSRMRLARISA